MAAKKKPVVPRDAAATRARILEAATVEFAAKGLFGARVDEIAERSGSNKRMIYHYFGSKDELFTAVLETEWAAIRAAEHALDLEGLPPRIALERMVRFTWHYYVDNPQFMKLVHSANLHKARHLENSPVIRQISDPYISLINSVLQRGVDSGDFRPGIDVMQLNVTLAGISYFYLVNRYTTEIIYNRELMTPEALETRLQFNIDTIMRLVAA